MFQLARFHIPTPRQVTTVTHNLWQIERSVTRKNSVSAISRQVGQTVHHFSTVSIHIAADQGQATRANVFLVGAPRSLHRGLDRQRFLSGKHQVLAITREAVVSEIPTRTRYTNSPTNHLLTREHRDRLSR